MENKVITVGSGRVLEDGKTVPLEVKVGDRVLFGKYVALYECMDCGQVGSNVDLRSHAEEGDGCRNFRITTTLVSPDGKLLDERVEVCQC